MTLAEISKLDFASAQEMLLAYMTDIKTHEKDIETVKRDVALWRSRVALAESKGLAELANGARKQLGESEEKLSQIEASKAELVADAQRIKEAIPGIKAKERSIDPDLLQAQLSMMTGESLDPEKARLDKELSALDAAPKSDSALDELKRKMGLAPDGTSGASGAANESGKPENSQ
jgi:chromosome segregation ATPase